jgi:dihydroxyacid dehydratase/phosphogluconate dehydratase
VGKTVSLITDARFSGVSTGACLGTLRRKRWRAGRLASFAAAI